MQRHLLLTISDDMSASYNLRFIHHFFHDPCAIRVTLFYVAPKAPERPLAGLSPGPEVRRALAELSATHAPLALAKARRWIVDMGCPEAQVDLKVASFGQGVVREIVREARHGLYDAVVLGRRGLSWFEELMEDSVSHHLLRGQIDFPVWICQRPDPGLTKDVLVCVDGSNAALRMADHVGFMLGGPEREAMESCDLAQCGQGGDSAPLGMLHEAAPRPPCPRHKAVVFHVALPGVRSPVPVEDILARARQALEDNGVAPCRIETRFVPGTNVAEAILAETRQGRYSVVAMGRQVSEPEGFRLFQPGSVSTRLLRQMEDFSLWISK